MTLIIKIKTLIIVTTALLFANTAAAKIYKWVDDSGRVHFSDVKPGDIENVEEPYNKLKNVKTGTNSAQVERFFPGNWEVNVTQFHNGQAVQVTGVITYERNGLVSSDLSATLIQNDTSIQPAKIPMKLKGRWYQSDNTEITATFVTEYQGQENTETKAQVIIEINNDYMITLDSEGNEERMNRVIEDDSAQSF